MDQMNMENNAGKTCGDCKNCSGCKKCGCGHHKVVPTLIVLIGLDILLGAFNVFGQSTTTIILAIALILIGGMKLMKGRCKCC